MATAPLLVVPKKNVCTFAASAEGMSEGSGTSVGTGPEEQWRVS